MSKLNFTDRVTVTGRITPSEPHMIDSERDYLAEFHSDYGSDPQNPLMPLDFVYALVASAYHAYRIATPIMPDPLYDALEKRLLATYPDALHEIERGVSSQLYREHLTLPHEMNGITQINDVALDDEYNDSRLDDYLREVGAKEYHVSDKLDGVSMMLRYVNGNLKQAFSKHTGTEGLDITRHALAMPSVPKSITASGEVFVRGEAIISVQMFNDYWSMDEGTGDYANPRNFVAGKLNAKEPCGGALSYIDFIAYTICDSEDDKATQLYTLGCEWGFTAAEYFVFEPKNMRSSNLRNYLEARKSSSPYELDGLVIDPVGSGNTEDDRRKFKVASEEATTVVTEVTYELHKNGEFRPRVWIEPVKLNGVTVTKASAFNAFYVVHGRLLSETWKPDHPIGPGAVVRIIRSGDVIPDIQEVITPATEPQLPDTAQWGEYEWSESGIHLITTNPDHPAVKFRRLCFFFNNLDVPGFRNASIAKLFDMGFDTVPKILALSQAELVEIFGPTTGIQHHENLRWSLDGVYLPTLMASSGCFGAGFGNSLSDSLYQAYEGDCLDWTGYTTEEIAAEVEELEAFGGTRAWQFAKGLPDFLAFKAELEQFDFVRIAEYEAKTQASNKLEGWKVVFTGVRNADLEAQIVDNGGEMASWTKCNIIVAKDPGLIRPKMQKAMDRGAKLYSVAEFQAKMNEALA